MTEFEYWEFGILIGLDVVMVTIFTIIHSHVWTKNGYAGVDKILDDREVDKFIAHVLAETSVICLFTICMLEPMTSQHHKFLYTLDTKFFFAALFLGSGLYTAAKKTIKDKFSDKD